MSIFMLISGGFEPLDILPLKQPRRPSHHHPGLDLFSFDPEIESLASDAEHLAGLGRCDDSLGVECFGHGDH